MGFTAALGLFIEHRSLYKRRTGYYLRDTLAGEGTVHDYPPLRNYVIGMTALDTIERLAVIFALAVPCYYSLTGDLLSNSAEMYALLGVTATSIVIRMAVDMQNAVRKIGVLIVQPSKENGTPNYETYTSLAKWRDAELTKRTDLVALFFSTLMTIAALFAVIVSCYYFHTNNLLSSDLEAHLLMAGGAALLITTNLSVSVMSPVRLFQTLDRLYARSKQPEQPTQNTSA